MQTDDLGNSKIQLKSLSIKFSLELVSIVRYHTT